MMMMCRLFVLWFILAASSALAGVSYTVSGSHDRKHLGYFSQKSISGGFGVDFDVNAFLRLGVSHSQQINRQEGFKTNDDETIFLAYLSHTSVVANALNLTLAPFHSVVAPFVFGGPSFYRVVKSEHIDGVKQDEDGRFFGPQGGIGLNVNVSKRLGLRLTHTFSSGAFKTPADKKGISKLNNTTQIGLSFRP